MNTNEDSVFRWLDPAYLEEHGMTYKMLYISLLAFKEPERFALLMGKKRTDETGYTRLAEEMKELQFEELASLAYLHRMALRMGGGRMIRKGFQMKLYPGMEEEYERRHKQLWPEMTEMIHEYGGHNYSIFLDRETRTLYGYIEIEDEARWAAGADTAVNRRWWDFMADIMETNEDNSPVCVDLSPVFHLD